MPCVRYGLKWSKALRKKFCDKMGSDNDPTPLLRFVNVDLLIAEKY